MHTLVSSDLAGLPADGPTMIDVVAGLSAITDRLGRGDLRGRLDTAQQRLGDPRTRIAIAGSSRTGMSELVTALLGTRVARSDATARIPVSFQWADTPSVRLIETDDQGHRTVVAHRDATTDLAEVDEAVHGDRTCAEIRLPAPFLADGLVLTDTPGASTSDARRAATTLTVVAAADAVLYVSDASQELTRPDLTFLRQIQQVCPLVVCALSKIDAYPHWQRIQQANRTHLAGAGLDLPILPVSSTMSIEAARLHDDELQVESGIPQLYGFLRGPVVDEISAQIAEAVAGDIALTCDNLSVALTSERRMLDDPAQSAAIVDRLDTARNAVDHLRTRSANWQYTLGDGIADLSSDVEHDLRHRLRTIIIEAEADISRSDPAPRWDSFGTWIDGQISDAVRENFVLAHRRSQELAVRVATRFADEGSIALPQLSVDSIDSVLDPVRSLDALDSAKPGVVQRVIGSMRGSYGGILMVGLATSLMGLALVNPFSIGAGVLLGANTFWEDRKMRTTRRQAEAKVAVARLMDDVNFQVNKESKDRLRQVQRVLREHFTTIADQLHRSVEDALIAAEQAARVHDEQRSRRIREIDAEMGQIAMLRRAAQELAGRPTLVAGAA